MRLKFASNKFIASFLTFIFFTTGCSTNRGPELIPKERFSYNEEIIRSHNEQMLLNLARLRYNDVPLFLDLNGVVTQYSVTNNASLGSALALTNQADSKASAVTTSSASAGMSFNEKPTMTYSPLQGEEFAKRILTPMTPQTLVLLTQSGWSVARLFLIAVQRFNGVENASTASGPTPEMAPQFEAFHGSMDSLRALQRVGAFRADVRREGESVHVWVVFDQALAKTSAEKEHLKKVYEAFGLPRDQSEFKVVTGGTSKGPGEIAISTRSLLGVLYFLSHGIQPPEDHLEEGVLRMTQQGNGEVFDWNVILGDVLKIQSSRKQPSHAYVKAFYRKHWFYIADNDLNSKSTFNLLHYLFALQSAEGSGKSPLLSLNL